MAEILAIGRSTAYELIRSHALRSVTIGNARRDSKTAIEEYLAQLDDPNLD